jgi:hypothetical protein
LLDREHTHCPLTLFLPLKQLLDTSMTRQHPNVTESTVGLITCGSRHLSVFEEIANLTPKVLVQGNQSRERNWLCFAINQKFFSVISTLRRACIVCRSTWDARALIN